MGRMKNQYQSKRPRSKSSNGVQKSLLFGFLLCNAVLVQQGRWANAFVIGNVVSKSAIFPGIVDTGICSLKNSRRQLYNLDSRSSHREISSRTLVEAKSSENDALGPDVYKNAVIKTLLWVTAAMAFGTGLFFTFGREIGEEFFAGYLIEESLSVDNLFVFLLLFEYFKVPIEYQNRVLDWGIFGAMVMRASIIGLGSIAIHKFHEILLVFAAILIFSSGKILFAGDEEEEDLENNAIIKFSRNLISATPTFDGDRFFTVIDGIKQATPLFLCLIAVEISDIVFAVDSIPAVFGVTENPLVVFSSNMFAICGLRSLYVILSKAAADLKYLEPAVAVVLAFIGGKMFAEYFGYNVATELSLAVVASLLGVGVGASIWEKKNEEALTLEEVDSKL